ncbi:MAG: gliding motility protein GldL [Bacteroidetes bacterium]|nr:gliding motility protein GldL [Bacteroidota bacterium]
MRPGTKAWKNFMAKLYGIGAAIVIVGALFKIMHWPGAGIMLTIGLSTEAVIFFFSAFEPPHEEVDWSLVYPELSGMHGSHEEETEADKGTITEQLDNMLEEAKIGPELIESLGQGMRNLSENANKIADVSAGTVATNEFVSNIKTASKSVESLSSSYDEARNSISSSVSQLSGSYSKAIQSLETFSNSSASSYEQAQTYSEQLGKVSKNLSALNASYELQLQGSQDHLGSTNKLYAGIEELMKNLNASVEDTRKYKAEMESLSSNLAALNTIYGNMLSALNYKK